MSWESTTSYYQIINETIKRELGGLHSDKILFYSIDFAEIEYYQANGEWDKSAEVLSRVAQKLEQTGMTLSSSVPIPYTRLHRRFRRKLQFQFCTLRDQLLKPW